MHKENYMPRKWSIMHLWAISVCRVYACQTVSPQLKVRKKKTLLVYCPFSNENISALDSAHLSTDT